MTYFQHYSGDMIEQMIEACIRAEFAAQTMRQNKANWIDIAIDICLSPYREN